MLVSGYIGDLEDVSLLR